MLKISVDVQCGENHENLLNLRTAFEMNPDSTTLRTLTLDLTCNRVGDAGAQALAMLKDGTTLRILSLKLGGNNIADGGAQALATTLQHTLDLRGNLI